MRVFSKFTILTALALVAGGITLWAPTQASAQFNIEGIIRGAGTIGDVLLRLFNSAVGRINANQTLGLTIVGDAAAVTAGTESSNYNAGFVATTGSGGLTIDGAFGNAGTLEALGTGALTINGEHLAGGGINSGGGTVEAFAGSSIVLENNAEVTSQTYVSIAAGATMTTTSGDTGDVVTSDLINNGTFDVAAKSTVTVDDSWENFGAVNLNGSASGAAQIVIELLK